MPDVAAIAKVAIAIAMPAWACLWRVEPSFSRVSAAWPLWFAWASPTRAGGWATGALIRGTQRPETAISSPPAQLLRAARNRDCDWKLSVVRDVFKGGAHERQVFTQRPEGSHPRGSPLGLAGPRRD